MDLDDTHLKINEPEPHARRPISGFGLKMMSICVCLLIMGSIYIPTVASAGPLTLKWQSKLNVSYGQFHPCLGDVNKDGSQEIVIKFGNYINVLNGKTGTTLWTSPKDAGNGDQILELADLNKDGTPEIIYPSIDMCVVARDGFGNLKWKSANVGGAGWPGTAIVSGDTNHDGYPEIYVVTQDTTSPYTARVTMLNHNGVIVARSEILYYPCWGGISLADANIDGKYEVYVSDRAASEGPGGSSKSYPSNPARGIECYDATTLKTLWTRKDIYGSSSAPVLADVNKDGKLEVVVNYVYNGGAAVLDAATGATLYNLKGKPLNDHAKGTVVDIDGDGHLELISSWGYQDTAKCTKDFTVADLVTGVIEFRSTGINNYVAFPPTTGDVNGDGYQEILAATSGENGHGVVGQGMLYVYDRSYKVIQTVNNFPKNVQLWEPYCADVDNDGFNEVLVCNIQGQIWCYDSTGKAPTPTPSFWSAWYSPYRQGTSIYVKPLGGVTASLTVTAPNGGQSWVRGTAHTLTWTSSGSPGANVKIELMKGSTVNRVITSSTANDGSYSWTIPSTQTIGTDYMIRITSTTSSAITDSSNSNFSIIN